MMDYEKKYKEALERAKKLYNGRKTMHYTDEVNDLETIFPELQESEDERIRKEIISALKFANDDGVYDKHLAWLEKQKENPKSVNSNYSNCTLNVIYENRWQKVQDSLPDNPREVICKDSFGNYFIGRYYGEEHKHNVWTISVYDDEDKTNEHNPEVVEWCEIPSEKQKERDLDIVPELRPTAWGEGYQHGCKDTEEKYSGMMVCSQKEWDEAISDAFKHGMDEGKKQKERGPLTKEEEYILHRIIEYLEDETCPSEWISLLHDIYCLPYGKQKEQHPSTKFRSGDWVVYDGPLGHAILQVKDVVDGRYTFVDNDYTLLVEDSDEYLRPLTPEDVRDAFGPNTDTNIPEKPAEPYLF